MKTYLAVLALCCGALTPGAMAALVTYNLTVNGCSVGCNVLPAGTITVEQLVADNLQVTVQLGSDYSFRAANDPNHHGLVFNLAGNPVVVISNIISGDTTSQTWALSQAGTFNNSPFGLFEYALECTTCSPGMAGVTTRSLSFNLQASGLTLASFTATNSNSGNTFFAVDVVGKSSVAGLGQTGNIGALQGSSNGVPEPSTYVFTSAGLLALAWRRHSGKAAASTMAAKNPVITKL